MSTVCKTARSGIGKMDAEHPIRASKTYGISATASHYFPTVGGAPPSCPSLAVIRTHAVTTHTTGIAPDEIQVTDPEDG
jgi:hypothetical protein